MCKRCAEISGVALGSIVQRYILSMTEDQKEKLNNVDWSKSLVTTDEPSDLTEFLDSLDTDQLNGWVKAMKVC